MSSLSTGIKLAWKSRCGVKFSDKRLAFLLAAIGSMDRKRTVLYSRLIRAISRHKPEESLKLRVFCNHKPVVLLIRRGNEADYHVAGRLVRGDYAPLPNFKPKTIIDGGANIGIFSLYAKSYFPEANLICFEPNADNYRLLESNLRQNTIQAELHQMGLWSASSTAYFREDSSRTGFVQAEPGGIPIKVILPEITQDTWLKLDVEGAEYEILPALLRHGNFPRMITLEIHEFDSRGSGLLDLLKKHDYLISGNVNPAVTCARIAARQAMS